VTRRPMASSNALSLPGLPKAAPRGQLTAAQVTRHVARIDGAVRQLRQTRPLALPSCAWVRRDVGAPLYSDRWVRDTW
jgi:hypothetical protein